MRTRRRELEQFAEQMRRERNEMASDLSRAENVITIAKVEVQILEGEGVLLPRLARILNGGRP